VRSAKPEPLGNNVKRTTGLNGACSFRLVLVRA
jgi:hypothetical protein